MCVILAHQKIATTAKNPHLGMMGRIGLLCFPELVLRQWFDGESATVENSDLTLYGVLNLKRDCAGTDIKKHGDEWQNVIILT
jgi:hypothetical protein